MHFTGLRHCGVRKRYGYSIKNLEAGLVPYWVESLYTDLDAQLVGSIVDKFSGSLNCVIFDDYVNMDMHKSM